MPTVPDAHMCSVRALSALGLIPSASAAIDEMWLWNAVRSGITDPTTRPSTSRGARPGTESKQALPASQIRSRYVALRTPNFETPAPTTATRFMGSPWPSRNEGGLGEMGVTSYDAALSHAGVRAAAVRDGDDDHDLFG